MRPIRPPAAGRHCAASRGRVAGLLLALAAAASSGGCTRPVSDDAISEPVLPPARPVAVNEIIAIVPMGSRLVVATSAGLVSFTPESGAFRLWDGDSTTSHAHLRGLVVDEQGTAWTAHGAPDGASSAGAGEAPLPDASPGEASPPAAPRQGGVRAFAADGTVRAWFAAHGLPSEDVTAIALRSGGLPVVATSAGLAALETGGERFAALEPGPRRRLTVLDPLRGGASRSLTEFRPRDERITALASLGSVTWIGTNHGLLALREDAWVRVRMPSCRRDGLGSDVVVALGVRPDGVVAAVGWGGPDGVEPSGLVEITGGGTDAICHVPGVDVPAALTPSVASDGLTTWAATYEGLLVLRGTDATLLERGSVMPAEPPTAVAADGAGGVWVGFWGAGLAHVQGSDVTLWRLGSGGSAATIERRRLP